MSRQPKSWLRFLLGFSVLTSLAVAAIIALRPLPTISRSSAAFGNLAPSLQRAAFQAAPADPFEGGVAWLNSGPIRLRELKGKLVLLDFWTYCCINCHHILPSLAKLEEKYKNELVVIGVHTPKFDAEHDTENLRHKVDEYKIKHPVINDAEQAVWSAFNVHSWPTLVVLGPSGQEIARQSGEVSFEILDQFLGKAVAKYKAELNVEPFHFFAESEKAAAAQTPLLFPGKILADLPSKRLFIADTGHNRLVVTDLDGKSPILIGEGGSGLTDGLFEKAQFNRPQGLDLIGDTLYVADTENHALRAVDLKAKTVTTLAGNGQQSQRDPRLRLNAPAKSTALSSPWDITHAPGAKLLYIAMAGTHQIYRLDLPSGKISLWAGTGMEDIVDGPVNSACFAQPSGLATDGKHLFVADSEGSCVRSITMGAGSQVETFAGQHDVPNVLFSFGDVDGVGDVVRFQHCLGLAYGNNKLYVADTYNNKVKVCDLKSGNVQTLIGKGKAIAKDKPAELYQPGGLSLAGNTLYIADTNNHKIRRFDLASQTVETLDIESLSPPAPKAGKPSFRNPVTKTEAKASIAPAKELKLVVALPIPPGFKLNTEGTMPVLIETPGHTGILSPEVPPAGARIAPAKQFTLDVIFAEGLKAGQIFDLKISVGAFICSEGSSLCTIKSYIWNIPIEAKAGASDKLVIGAKSE